MSKTYFERKIGDACIYLKPSRHGEGWEGYIEIGNEVVWEFDDLHPPKIRLAGQDDEDLIDGLAASAVSFGSYYSTHNRGDDVPDWAPPADMADRIEEATQFVQDDQGNFEVERVNPAAGLTAKGERMYEHVKASYAGDPGLETRSRAKEIAARTVYARAGEGAPGLKKNPSSEYQWFVTGHFKKGGLKIFSGWEFKSDAFDDLRENGAYYASLGAKNVGVMSRKTISFSGDESSPDEEHLWFRKNPHRDMDVIADQDLSPTSIARKLASWAEDNYPKMRNVRLLANTVANTEPDFRYDALDDLIATVNRQLPAGVSVGWHPHESGTLMVGDETWFEENPSSKKRSPGRWKNIRRLEDTELEKWFERNRSHVALRDKKTGETIIEWWDDDFAAAVEYGFLDPRRLHRSAYDYAKHMGVIP
jgi:hypothetical protein